ncbi:type VI secretion system-associated FHA domain protein TagH [Bradyrhizobium ivorense]|uniref:type VI secretion system-associated FHA domain protein TagH n=1 Tax=Bradyrhizobium ivorense TaxID=2511166 RepID=UPI0010B239A0|nr:type VI secretion system-associated FHA domain protein TagH [Bradyrhizobium ivorense]VIO78085.1 hypothetical protein CI41S_61130 [Bradyrhizobium ivorense]
MALTLKIENQTSLPDGGPLSISIQGKRGIDIGRNQYLDWTLPDPSRLISGRHCEVRWREGGYWLHDISSNGTFLQGDSNRLKEPHLLRNGDRFAIGHYIIAVELDEDATPAGTPAPGTPVVDYGGLWTSTEDAAPPIDRKELRGPRDLRPVGPDFLDWAVDVPSAQVPPSSPQGAPRGLKPAQPQVEPAESWADAPAKRPPAEPAINPLPNPRRASPAPAEPNVWGAESIEPSAASLPSGIQAQPTRPEPREVPAPNENGEAVAEKGTGKSSGAGADFNRMFARGAGLSDDPFAARDPAEFAEQLGQLTLLVIENMRQLLDARQQAKRLARSADQTTVQAFDNNPLKFAPTVEDALRIMFGSKNRGFLDARGALTQGFDDVKRHQVKTYIAMQQAFKLVIEEFDPANIEAKSTSDRGLVAMVSSNKARLWDIHVARWQARTQHHKDGMLRAFMDYFAECYDRAGNDVG